MESPYADDIAKLVDLLADCLNVLDSALRATVETSDAGQSPVLLSSIDVGHLKEALERCLGLVDDVRRCCDSLHCRHVDRGSRCPATSSVDPMESALDLTSTTGARSTARRLTSGCRPLGLALSVDDVETDSAMDNDPGSDYQPPSADDRSRSSAQQPSASAADDGDREPAATVAESTSGLHFQLPLTTSFATTMTTSLSAGRTPAAPLMTSSWSLPPPVTSRGPDAADACVTVPKEVLDRITEQNQRLKSTLRQCIEQRHGSIQRYLTTQEYEDVIKQLRNDVRVLSLRAENLRDLLRARNTSNVDALTERCAQLSDKVSLLEQSVAVKQALLDAAIIQQRRHQQQQPSTEQQHTTSAALLSSTDDERLLSRQLMAEFIELRHLYAESDARYRKQIDSLQVQLQQLRATDVQRIDSDNLHWPVTEVGDEAAGKSSDRIGGGDMALIGRVEDLASVEIIRPPPIVNSNTAPPSALLMCPRCERQFGACDEHQFLIHCSRCVDD